MSSFRLLLAASTVSSLGNGMRWVALPLLAAGVTSDPRAVSFVTAAEQLPWLVFGIAAGVLADRSDRKALMWQSNLARGAVMVAFTAVVWSDLAGSAGIWPIAAVGFAITCGDALGGAAFAGLLPALVPPDRLRHANSRMEVGDLIADPLVGSVLGALLFGLAAPLPFGLDAVTFFAAAALVAVVPGRYRPAVSSEVDGRSFRTEAVAGLRFLWNTRALRYLCGLLALAMMIESGLVAILVLYAQRVLGLSSVWYGVLIACFAVGGVVGALLAPRIAAKIGERTALLIAIGGCGTAVAVMGLVGTFAVAAVAIAVYGAAQSLWNLVTVTVRQTLVPDALMGRVVNSFRMVIFSVTPVGAVVGGFIAHAAGLRAPFLVGALGFGAALALAVLSGPAVARYYRAEPVPEQGVHAQPAPHR